ncbi:hypothetical protein DICVIV_07024 [Dictyocaulus viviparus]|uniref:Uncharacterized protein n=1 Tax=Dictyocaulus viviparus TaxID=29172 RepID=A0A0D8XQH2_DICVI|nr:hypothetical protein DICVIV_07024 [Dictyocaulus viviparus]
MDGIGANQKHWEGVWPGAKCLGVVPLSTEFICCNHNIFANSVCLELGSGTGIVGLSLGKLGAKKILSIIRANVVRNGLSDVCEIKGLDWQDANNVMVMINGLTELDYLIASDVFYDNQSSVVVHQNWLWFEIDNGLVDNWSIEDLLLLSNLQIRLVSTRFLDNSCIEIGVIYRKAMSVDIFCGVEGGATESKLVFMSSAGEILGRSSSDGTNYNLDGIEKCASAIASWVRNAAKKEGIALPLKGLGLGLSGAEGVRDNARFVQHIEANYGDLAEHIFLTSDSVATVATVFDHGSGDIALKF